MRDATEYGARRLGVRRLILATASALIVTGCVSPAFRETVGQFGTLTKGTATAQNERLAAVAANEQERIRTDLAEARVAPRMNRDCGELVPPAPGARFRPCVLLNGSTPVAEPERYANIIGLSNALSNYGDSLVALAADSAADQAAFNKALGGIATSIGGLDTAIRKITGAAAGNTGARLGAVAAVVGEIGNLYFAAERNRVLRRTIIEADPYIQRAVALLTGADRGIELYDRNAGFQRMSAAEAEVRELVRRNAPVAEIRRAQDRLFDRVAAYNAYGAAIRRFEAIGAAHTRLVAAARAGASAAEIRTAFETIIRLFNVANETVTTLRGNGEEANDGN